MTGAKMPRFVASNDPDMVVEIDDCVTTLLFPFVTNKAGFDTGIAITNTSSDAGSCTITYFTAPTLLTSSGKRGDIAAGASDGLPGVRLHWTSRATSRQPAAFGMRTALPLSLTASGAEIPPWRRAISLYARIATTKKGHRATAPRVRK